jgi:hypothetical protein
MERKYCTFVGTVQRFCFDDCGVTPILVNHETDCIGKIISLSFHAYKERPNRRSYTSCALIWLKARWSWTPNWKQIWEVNKHDLDKLERNKDIRYKYGNEIYMIETFFIIVLWKGIISRLRVHTGVRLDILWKGNIAFLRVLANNFVSVIVVDSDFSWPWY